MTIRQLEIFATPPHPCSYLADRVAVNAVLNPMLTPNMALFGQLIDVGFRRSGCQLYRPHCPACRGCVSCRVPADKFVPDRAQRRCWRRNQDLDVRVRPPRLTDEYFALYTRYLALRHPGGGMDNPAPASFEQFLISDWCHTEFIEFRAQGTLLAVAVVDCLPNSLSSVYTFYDPDASERGLGTYAILWQIAEAHRRKLGYVHLGYWIRDSAKMNYKIRFQPLEGFVDYRWQALPT
ncbi:MAG: arginyltransferase, partial [Thiotrichales bacterium]